MSDLGEIRHERQASGGRYTLIVEGQESVLTYSLAGTRMIIRHTYVPRPQRGRNYGQALVRRALADAQAEGLEVEPVCSFARAEMERLGKATGK